MAVNAVILFRHSTGVWFWADDWDLLFQRGVVPALDEGWLAPHNNHWLTAHIAVYRVLFDVFGIGSYRPFAAAEIAFHLTVVALVHLLVRRAGGGRWVAVMTALMVAFYGLGANAQIPSASMNHVGALACGLLAALVVVRPGQLDVRRLALVWLALVGALMFGLTSLALVVLVVVLAALVHGALRAGAVLAVPLVVFAAWWLAYGSHSGVNSISPSFDLTGNLPGVPAYVWTGITGTLGDGSGLIGSGPVLAALILLALLAPAGPTATPPPLLVKLAWAGFVAELFQLLAVSVARYNYGASQIGNSHYAYINLVLLAPSIALVGWRVVRWTPTPRWALGALVGVVFVAYALNGITSVRQWQQNFAYVSGSSADLARGIKAALVAHEKVLDDTNPDVFNKGLSPYYLNNPRVLHALGSTKPTGVGRLTAEATFFTTVDTEDHGLAKPPVGLSAEGLTPLRDRAGCQRVQTTQSSPTIRLMTGDGGNEVVVWSTSTQVEVHLERGSADSPEHTYTVKPGAVHVATSAEDVDLYATFNGTGSFTVCRG